MKQLWIAIAAVTLLAASRQKPAAPVPSPDPASGLVAIYVKTLPPEARRLTLRLAGVSAVREDGSSVPLELKLDELKGDAPSGQRLLAWGTVPAGRYTGFAIAPASATLAGDDGARELTLPESPSPTAFAFTSGPGRAHLLTAELDFKASLGDEGRFAPVFGLAAPGKLATGLVGAVASRSMGALVLFDKMSGQASSLVAVGRGPQGLAHDSSRHRLYVALSGDDAIATVDLLDASVLATFRLRAGDEPVSLALSSDGKTLFAANSGTSTVSVLDASSTALVERRRVETGSGPRYIVMDPSGNKAWVFNALDDSINVLAVPSGGLLGTVRSGGGPIRADFGRSGARLYVIHKTSTYVDAVDTATLTVAQRVAVGPGTNAIKVDPKTGRIYLGFRESGRLDVFDPNSFLPIDAIEAGGSPSHLTIDSEGNNLCIAIPSKGEVRLVRLVGKSLVAHIDVPDPVEVSLPGER